MESTGIYWKEPYHTLEKAGLNVILANAYVVKHVPGHKTDVEDSRWLAILARSGLLTKSRVLDRERDQMRQAARLRQSYTEDMTRYKNRMYKMLIEAGFSVSQVVTDLFGKSGIVIVEGLLEGASPHEILKRVESHVGYRLKAPRERLIDALQGEMSDLLRHQLKMLLGTVRQMQANIADLEKTIEEKLMEHGLERELAML
jgi:transposase